MMAEVEAQVPQVTPAEVESRREGHSTGEASSDGSDTRCRPADLQRDEVDSCCGESRGCNFVTLFAHFIHPIFCVINYLAWVRRRRSDLGDFKTDMYMWLTILAMVAYFFGSSQFYILANRWPVPKKRAAKWTSWGVLINLLTCDFPIFVLEVNICWTVGLVSNLQVLCFMLTCMSFISSGVRSWCFLVNKFIRHEIRQEREPKEAPAGAVSAEHGTDEGRAPGFFPPAHFVEEKHVVPVVCMLVWFVSTAASVANYVAYIRTNEAKARYGLVLVRCYLSFIIVSLVVYFTVSGTMWTWSWRYAQERVMRRQKTVTGILAMFLLSSCPLWSMDYRTIDLDGSVKTTWQLVSILCQSVTWFLGAVTMWLTFSHKTTKAMYNTRCHFGTCCCRIVCCAQVADPSTQQSASSYAVPASAPRSEVGDAPVVAETPIPIPMGAAGEAVRDQPVAPATIKPQHAPEWRSRAAQVATHAGRVATQARAMLSWQAPRPPTSAPQPTLPAPVPDLPSSACRRVVREPEQQLPMPRQSPLLPSAPAPAPALVPHLSQSPPAAFPALPPSLVPRASMSPPPTRPPSGGRQIDGSVEERGAAGLLGRALPPPPPDAALPANAAQASSPPPAWSSSCCASGIAQQTPYSSADTVYDVDV